MSENEQDKPEREFLDGFLKAAPATPVPDEVADFVPPAHMIERAPDTLEGKVAAALQEIFDPEIPVNIYDLGLIYAVQDAGNNHVNVVMTLTTPHCPVAESMPSEVEAKVKQVEGVESATLSLVWEPTWSPQMMSEVAQLELGFL